MGSCTHTHTKQSHKNIQTPLLNAYSQKTTRADTRLGAEYPKNRRTVSLDLRSDYIREAIAHVAAYVCDHYSEGATRRDGALTSNWRIMEALYTRYARISIVVRNDR